MASTPEHLFTLLASLGIETETIDHEPVFTVKESKHLHGLTPGAHTKNLFLRDNKRNYFLVSVEKDRVVDLKRMRPRIGAKGGLSFASPEALLDHLGITPGSVSPFAVINDTAKVVRVFLDESLLEAPVVNYHPLTNAKTTTIAPKDLVAFLRSTGHDPEPLSFSQQDDADQALA